MAGMPTLNSTHFKESKSFSRLRFSGNSSSSARGFNGLADGVRFHAKIAEHNNHVEALAAAAAVGPILYQAYGEK